MTDLRLLGVAMTDRSVTDVVNQFRIWKRVGFCMVTMGALLDSSEAVKYRPNPFFWAKMSLLVLIGVHALIFRPRVYNNTAAINKAPALPGIARLAGVLFAGVMAEYPDDGPADRLLGRAGSPGQAGAGGEIARRRGSTSHTGARSGSLSGGRPEVALDLEHQRYCRT